MTPSRIALVMALALSACKAAPPTGPPTREVTLVLLKTGPTTALDDEARRAVFAGHFANMQRLAEERELLVAGPYATDKHDAALRGLFILDEATRAGAEALAATDPGVAAGVFALELHTLTTDAPLVAYLEHELALEAAAKAEGRVRAPGEGGRTYVLVTAEDRGAAEPALAPLVASGQVLLLATHDGTGTFAVLDAEDVPAAEALLGERRAALGPHVLDQWFGSGEFAKLRTLGG